MRIVFIHHGNRKIENPRSQNEDLTELGYKDCELVAQLLEKAKTRDNFKAIYTSQFFRCKKTAEIINKFLNVPIFEDKRLDEYRSVNRETWVDLQTRVGECLDDLVGKYDDEDTIICVTSGLNVVAFTNKAYNLPPSETAPFMFIPSCSPIIFEFKKIINSWKSDSN